MSVPMEGQPFALDDAADLQDAEVVISFTETPRSTYGTAVVGRHVEFGMALAWGKRLIVIGPRENVFQTMPGGPTLLGMGARCRECAERAGG